jgi:Ca2+-binding EF-hand superfamily protein
LKEQFHKIDTNLDGTLTYDELSIGLKHLTSLEMLKSNDFEENQEETILKIMERCDMDGDGKIDYLEFVQAAIDHKALLNKDNIQAIFNLLDSNGDGEIDMKEFKENFRGSGSEQGDEMFE